MTIKVCTVPSENGSWSRHTRDGAYQLCLKLCTSCK